jgi:hypothetical protein
MADESIKVTFKEEMRGNNRYQLYSCICRPSFFGPYEQIILHLTTEHRFTLQEAEVIVQYAQHGRSSDLDTWQYWK